MCRGRKSKQGFKVPGTFASFRRGNLVTVIMKMYSISLALLFAMPSVSNAQLSREERLKVDAVAEQIFAKEGAPGLALGVAKNGRLIYF